MQKSKFIKYVQYFSSCSKKCYFIALLYLVIAIALDIGKAYAPYENVIPKMTADFDQGVHIFSTIPQIPGNQVFYGFDGDFKTVFHSPKLMNKGGITIEIPQERVLGIIRISPQVSISTRCPRDFILSGSRNGVDEWIQLGNYANVSCDGLWAGQFSDIQVSTDISFRFYRIEFKGNNDDYLAFSELQLMSIGSNPYNIFMYYFFVICMALLIIFWPIGMRWTRLHDTEN